MKISCSSVTVFTQVYNTKGFIKQCIESVLQQTYPYFEYIIVDNGCTDGSSEILENFAKLDKRIRLVRFNTNRKQFAPMLIKKMTKSEYITVIDSDDWWETDYLERLIKFMKNNYLDLAVTGTSTYFEESQAHQIMRKLENPAIFTLQQYAKKFSQYWAFTSTFWGNLMKRELFVSADMEAVLEKKAAYGTDTMIMLKYLSNCKNVGIDNSVLYHYRIHKKGISYKYRTNRLDANVFCYKAIAEFLNENFALDSRKKEWLKLVHASALTTTLQLLRESSLPPLEKAKECARIAAHPLTEHIFEQPVPEEAGTLRAALLTVLLQAAGQCVELEPDYVAEAARHIAPACCGAVWAGNAGLYLKEPGLCKALLEDNSNGLMAELLVLISQKKYSKQYDLGKIAQGLNPKGSLLHEVTDTRFIREHLEIYQMLYREERLQALDAMTGLLLEGKRLYGRERFLMLYLSVAALEEQIPAFLFGKEQLALLLYEEARLEECRGVLSELAEMGVEDSEVIVAIKQALEGAT